MGGSAAKVNDAIQKRDDKWAEAGAHTRPLFSSTQTLFRGIRWVVSLTRMAHVDLASGQGRTLVHFSAQRRHFLWDRLGGFSEKNGACGAARWTSVSPWAKEGPPQASKIAEEDVLVLEGAA
jgi:hypothetical protein